MPKLNVLFLCTGNSCRSVMGETILRSLAGDKFDVYSAGTEPKGINPTAIRVLHEIGIDTTGVSSQHVSEYLGKLPVEYAIIVCDDAAEKCPRAWPGMRHKLFWPFDDPPAFQGTEEETLAKYREVRDAIRERIRAWLAELETAARSG